MTATTRSQPSSSRHSSMLAISTIPPPGNPANTVDNNITSPTWGESLPYGSTCLIEWNATTSGSISVFWRVRLPPQTTTVTIDQCQNLKNLPGSIMSCPWAVFPFALPVSFNQGFEIVLVWNSSTTGQQISPQFGVFNASSPTISMTSNTSSISIQVGTSSTPTTSPPPNAITQAEHAMSEKIGLGVGLGIGIPLIALLFAAFLFLRRRRSRDNAGDATELSQRSNNRPLYSSSRLAKATMQPHSSELETPELLANYRNAEHFGFRPTNLTNR